MNLCLIAPPTVTEFEGTPTSRSEAVRLTAEYPPLGILTLAATLGRARVPHEIFDLNTLFLQEPARVFERAVAALENIGAAVFGFGTISSSYPLTVRLAREVKRMHPGSTIVFGGPQATAVDTETLTAFPWVDVIVRGEADGTLLPLLEALAGRGELAGVPGLTVRSNSHPVRTSDAPPVLDLDSLPLPSFQLWPPMRGRETAPIEVGRGCPYACTFCSTSSFFRRRYRVKSPERVLEHMRLVRDAYGIKTFHLVHDAFTAVRDSVSAFCRVMLASGEGFHWTCSARADCADEDLLSLMAEAGCTGIFYGVETGSPRMQPLLNKNLELGEAIEAVRRSDRRAIRTTVSLIAGFPEETRDDVRATAAFLLDSLRCDNVQAQFHLLAPLAGSALHAQYRGRLEWDGIFSDMAFQGWRQDAGDRDFILRYPEVFPNFYALPAAHLDRPWLMELRDFLVYALARFRWLMIAVHDYAGGIVDVFDRWRTWRDLHHPVPRADGEYHTSDAFRRALLEFIASEFCGSLAVSTLLEYETTLENSPESREPPNTASIADRSLTLDVTPRIAPGVTLIELNADYHRIIDCLRAGRASAGVERQKVKIADIVKPDGSVEVLQLSPLPAALLALCDGTRTVRDIAAIFPSLTAGLSDLPPAPAAAFALSALAHQGLILL